MGEDLAQKTESENSNIMEASNYSRPPRKESQDGGFLATMAATGSFMILSNAFDTDLKILGALFTMPLLVIGSYDVYRYYADSRKKRRNRQA